jgi:hypothetical protein
MTGDRPDVGVDDLVRSEVVMAAEFDRPESWPSADDIDDWRGRRRHSRGYAEAGCGHLEVTPERLSVRWLRLPHDAYPSYDDIWPIFADDLRAFRGFASSPGLAEAPMTTCELTYVNPVSPGEDWKRRGPLERMLMQWAGVDPGETLLPVPDDIQADTRYKISGHGGAPVGRLSVSVHSVWVEAPEPMVLVTLSAQGHPVGGGTKGVKEFFDTGFEWIVRGFASWSTTPDHQLAD